MSSFISTTSSSSNDTCAPVAGWLTKMISLPFGRSRWTSRFFVLLDSELRFYKDEHSDSASQILNLRKVCQVIPTPTTRHPFCFRLEPQQYTSENVMRPWIIECKSEADMENWITAIQSRIIKYNNPMMNSPCNTSSATSLLSPKTPIPETTKLAAARIVSTYSIMNNASPESYRMPTLPLRCTNLTASDDEEEEEAKESLLIRRNKKLAPIITLQKQHEEVIVSEELALQTSFSTSTACSSTLPSPTGAVLGPIISPGIIDRYSYYRSSSDHIHTSFCTTTIPSTLPPALMISTAKGALLSQEKEEGEQSSSPTYLMYKKRFHL